MALHSRFAHNFKARPQHLLSNSKNFAGRSVGELIAVTKTKVTHKPMEQLELRWGGREGRREGGREGEGGGGGAW